MWRSAAGKEGCIGGTTRLAGVIWWPVTHSLSPRMHNAAFRALGLDWVYVPLPVPPPRLPDALRGLSALGFAGINVTVPHKTVVGPHLDALTAIARAAGAVNTVVVRTDGSLLGDNTDGAGFLADLAAHGIALPSTCAGNGWVLLLGAGGAARAVAYALAEAGVRVVVANRTAAHAEALCRDIAAASPSAAGLLSAHRLPDDLARLARGASLIVNATVLGLREGDPSPWNDGAPFNPSQTVYDLIYNRPTPLLALARAAGARAVDGLGMLVQQGARAFELWTGCPAPVEVMRAAVLAGLS